MINGLIIYNANDALKNEWFINCCLDKLNDDNFSLLYKEESEVLFYIVEHKIDYVIYRGRDYRLLEVIQRKGIKCFNNPYTNQIANDKFASYLLFKDSGLPVLETFLNDPNSLKYPFVMKSLNGHGGQEDYLINSDVEMKAILKKSRKSYLYQEYLPNSQDVRLYVLNHKIIGAVIRKNDKDFRSNFSLGGEIEKYEPSSKMKEMAVKISKLLNATYIGVDFLIKNEQIYVNEIEDPVGARMLYQIGKTNFIDLYINEIKRQLK